MTFSWQNAERLAVEHMVALGYKDATATVGGADRGLDAVSEAHRVAAQVKHYAVPVGRPEVQQLVGAAAQFGERLFYALSGFTRAAQEYAAEADVALFRYETGNVYPMNGRARELTDRGDPEWRLRALLEKQREEQRIQHLRDNPPPSDYDYEILYEFPYSLHRHMSLSKLLPSFESRVVSEQPEAGRERVEAIRSLKSRADTLLLEHSLATKDIPREWRADVRRLYEHRSTLAHLERQLASWLAPSMDISHLLDLNSELGALDFPIDAPLRQGAVPMLPSEDEWTRLRFSIAAAIVRREGLLAVLPELDKKGRFVARWERIGERAKSELYDVASSLGRPSYWVGDDHYERRRRGATDSIQRIIEVEDGIVSFWSSDTLGRRRTDVAAAVSLHAEAWMRSNEASPEVQFLRRFAYSTRPLEPLPSLES